MPRSCSPRGRTDRPGNSLKSPAAAQAVKNASRTVKNITGVQVQHMTAQCKNGKIKTYKTTVKVAFGVED